jgi:hypothetical protein
MVVVVVMMMVVVVGEDSVCEYFVNTGAHPPVSVECWHS